MTNEEVIKCLEKRKTVYLSETNLKNEEVKRSLLNSVSDVEKIIYLRNKACLDVFLSSDLFLDK